MGARCNSTLSAAALSCWPLYHILPLGFPNSTPCLSARTTHSVTPKHRPRPSNTGCWFCQFLVIYRCLDKGGGGVHGKKRFMALGQPVCMGAALPLAWDRGLRREGCRRDSPGTTLLVMPLWSSVRGCPGGAVRAAPTPCASLPLCQTRWLGTEPCRRPHWRLLCLDAGQRAPTAGEMANKRD